MSRMSLQNVTRGKVPQPFRVVVYGQEGVGKSTFGANAPSPIFLGTEKGTHHLDVARFPAPETWEDVLEAVRVLTEEEHDFQTLVLDSLDWAEPLCWDYVARQAGKKHIEDIGYGKGYVAAVDQWRVLLAALDRLSERKGMNVILIAHAQIKTFKNPIGEDFDRYALQLHEKSAAVIRQWPDAMLFARHEVVAKEQDKRVRGIDTGLRVLETMHAGGWDAKNRYDLPEQIELAWDVFARLAREGLSGKADKLISAVKVKAESLPEEARAKVGPALARAGRDIEKLEKLLAWCDEQLKKVNE